MFFFKLHFGHKIKNVNDSMTPYFLGHRDKISIFETEFLLYNLRYTAKLLELLFSQRSIFFLINIHKYFNTDELVQYFLNKLEKANKRNWVVGYASYRWFKGTFSNWRIVYQYQNEVTTYHKSKYQRLMRCYSGIEQKIFGIYPDFVFAFNYVDEVFYEFYNCKIPIIGIADSDAFSNYYTYKILGNDKGAYSQSFFYQFLENSILNGNSLENERFIYYCLFSIKNKLKNV